MNNIKKRSKKILNLKQYNKNNYPEFVSDINDICPYNKQYILRCLIKKGFDDFKIPDELLWLKNIIEKSYNYQKNIIKIEHSFCYVTVRHGLIESTTDDEWHVDGFSMRINHIPEQNYIYSNILPTEYLVKKLNLNNFNPFEENIHKIIQKNINNNSKINKLVINKLYCLDPYVIHRRPVIKDNNLNRTFVRISFTPIEIQDTNNTLNPLIPTNFNYDGVLQFRNNLK